MPSSPPLFARIRPEIPKVSAVVVFDGAPLDGMEPGDDLIAAAPTTEWSRTGRRATRPPPAPR